jgi:hypothetical protein
MSVMLIIEHNSEQEGKGYLWSQKPNSRSELFFSYSHFHEAKLVQIWEKVKTQIIKK